YQGSGPVVATAKRKSHQSHRRWWQSSPTGDSAVSESPLLSAHRGVDQNRRPWHRLLLGCRTLTGRSRCGERVAKGRSGCKQAFKTTPETSRPKNWAPGPPFPPGFYALLSEELCSQVP